MIEKVAHLCPNCDHEAYAHNDGIALHVRVSSFATFSRMPIPIRTALWANTVHTAERRV